MKIHERMLGWLNRWFHSRVGGERRPVFYDDIGAVCPELDELTRHYEEIRAEVLGVIDRGVRMPTYVDSDMTDKPIRLPTHGGGEKGWGLMMLYMMGERPEAHRRLFPKTVALVDRVPGLWQSQVSVLAPGKQIPAHKGQYWGYLRYHLALRVPEGEKPRIRVKDRWYEWREGEAVLFDDSWEHEVVNPSSEPRVVLMVDIRRPMGWFADRVNRFVTYHIVRRVYAPKVLASLPAIELEPKSGATEARSPQGDGATEGREARAGASLARDAGS